MAHRSTTVDELIAAARREAEAAATFEEICCPHHERQAPAAPMVGGDWRRPLVLDYTGVRIVLVEQRTESDQIYDLALEGAQLAAEAAELLEQTANELERVLQERDRFADQILEMSGKMLAADRALERLTEGDCIVRKCNCRHEICPGYILRLRSDL